MMMTQPSVSSLRNMMNAVEQSPDLQQELRQWVIQLIRGSDDLRQDLRREILTDELLQLPVRFTKMEQDVASLKDGQARLEQYVADLRTGLAQVSGHVGRLSGNDYEASAIERSRRLIRRLHRMEMGTVIHSGRPPSPTFDAEILIPAIRSGRITRDEADDLEDADCILRLEDPDKETIYAVVEISITVQETDRVRAARRAQVFSRVVGVEALPYVVGEQEEPSEDAVSRVTFVEYPAEYPAQL